VSTLEIHEAGPATVPVASIRRDEALICRARGVDVRIVGEYSEAMKAGATFPPIVVFRDAKGVHWLADGFHRTGAAELAELAEIPAEVRKGGRRDALLYAASANAAHGLRRTGADKRRSVELVLGAYPKKSDRWIADACGVSHPFVAKVRAQLVTVTSSDDDAREGADGKTRKARVFDVDRELARVEKALMVLSERWPARDGEGRARLAATLTAWGARFAPVDRPRRTAKTNGTTTAAVEAATG
jgi:hypothetical protein